jgi:hypothetical protein
LGAVFLALSELQYALYGSVGSSLDSILEIDTARPPFVGETCPVCTDTSRFLLGVVLETVGHIVSSQVTSSSFNFQSIASRSSLCRVIAELEAVQYTISVEFTSSVLPHTESCSSTGRDSFRPLSKTGFEGSQKC